MPRTFAEEFLTKRDLKEGGWTETLIAKFLPTPDLTWPNPHYPGAGRMRFYKVDRVEAVESSDAFKAEAEKTYKRRAARASDAAAPTQLSA